MSELLKEVPQIDPTKKVLTEKPVDEAGACPCDTNDKTCHQRWFQAIADCDQ